MDILVVGLGVIGATYGHLFKSAGHNVEHMIRPESPKARVESLNVELLDGRVDAAGVQWSSTYEIAHSSKTSYDLVFVSVPSGAIEAVVRDLDAADITGTLLICCGIWEDRDFINRAVGERPSLLGYPVAGGRIELDGHSLSGSPVADGTSPHKPLNGTLSCCVFGHFMLESEQNAAIAQYHDIACLFADCGIELECPHDMLEWIWLHMAINAAVVSVAGRHGDVEDTSASAERLMDSEALLAEAVLAIREASKIVESRGLDLRNYRDELAPYTIPLAVSAPVMKRMFAKSELTRKIMTLHGNTDDLIFVCRSLYDAGKAAGIEAPVFYTSCETVLGETSGRMKPAVLQTGSGAIRYWVDNTAGEESPWLVFLPGLTADHTLFAAQMEHFSGKANCLVWDAPAHGKSRPFALDFTMDDMAHLLDAILEREGVTSPILVGQSLGGYVAQVYLDLHPGKAAGFVAIDSSTLKRNYYPDWEVALLRHTKGMYLSIPWALLKAWGAVGAASTGEGRANMRSFMDGYSKREYCELAGFGFRLFADALDARRAYEIDCPALLLCGEKDIAGDVRKFNRKWSKGEEIPLVWVPDAGHNSNVDNHTFVNDQIEHFLERLPNGITQP